MTVFALLSLTLSSSPRKSPHSSPSLSMTKPSSGPIPRSLRLEKALLICVMMSRSNDGSSGSTFSSFLTHLRMLSSILHLLLGNMMRPYPGTSGRSCGVQTTEDRHRSTGVRDHTDFDLAERDLAGHGSRRRFDGHGALGADRVTGIRF